MIRNRQPLIQDWSLMKPHVTRADDKCVQKKGIRQPTISFLMKDMHGRNTMSPVMILGDQHVKCMHCVSISPRLTITNCVRPVSGVLCTWEEQGRPGPAPVFVIQIGPWTAKF